MEDLFGTPVIYEEKICVKRQQPTYLEFWWFMKKKFALRGLLPTYLGFQ